MAHRTRKLTLGTYLAARKGARSQMGSLKQITGSKVAKRQTTNLTLGAQGRNATSRKISEKAATRELVCED